MKTKPIHHGVREKNKHFDSAWKLKHHYRYQIARGGQDLNSMAMKAIQHNQWSHGSGNGYLSDNVKFYDDKDVKLETLCLIVIVLAFLIKFMGRK